jgi:uncharacterized protein YyaL (SSP411 family)
MPNRLAAERSPYLLQHAGNPVDWMPWGEEAFARAAAEDKPILVSIGYSACHWCHVMEHESFADPAVAALMNRSLVCVKVDREERPDVDRVYMHAVSGLTGQGGWPLNCFITPQGRPFYGGTYFPPRPAYGRPSWSQLVDAIGRAWKDPEQRPRVLQDADRLTEALRRQEASAPAAGGLDARPLDSSLDAFRRGYDQALGGFAGAPKFPMPVNQHLLLRMSLRLAGQGRAGEASEAADMALNTLRLMARGGIHDLLGGGFARYSTDERWHVPHFEKMLYDNAQLAMNYVEAWQMTKEEAFAGTVQGILGYALRDLLSPEGAFYSAEDADSLPAQGGESKREGAFYVWTRAEIDAILGEESDRFCSAFGVERDGNVHDDPHGEFQGLNVLYDRRGTLAAMAGFGDLPVEAQEGRLKASRLKLFEARAQRPRPQRDEKILASWNGLMIAALAKAAAAFGRPDWAQAGARAADFLLGALWDPASGRLWRRYAGGEAAVEGQADDYACLAWGLLELHQATLEPRWLDACVALMRAARPRFFDESDGLYFPGGIAGDPRLPARIKESHDNVEPAPASVFVDLQLRLWSLLGEASWREDAERTLKASFPDLLAAPRALPFMAAALDRALGAPVHLVVAGPAADPATRALLEAGREDFAPLVDRLRVDGDARLPGFSGGFALVDGISAAYVCRQFACERPVTDPGALRRMLGIAGAA